MAIGAMDFAQLRYFERVATLRSVSKAARELRVSQPAITRQIRLLEDELGVALLTRHSRGVEPTEAGSRLSDGAQGILRLIEHTRDEVLAKAAAPTGSIAIGFPPSIGDLVIAATVASYRAQYPGVTIHLLEAYSDVLREWLLSAKIDVAVMTALEPNPLLSVEPLYEEDVWLISSTPILKGSAKRVSLRSVLNRPLIQTNRANIMRQILERAAAATDVELNVIVEAEALTVIKQLVSRGLGSHVSLYSAVIRDAQRGDFYGAPIQDLSMSRVISYRVDRPVTRALLELIRMLRDELKRGAAVSGGCIRASRD
jgi:LysR family nitrogen assimilation transcriptional regulator